MIQCRIVLVNDTTTKTAPQGAIDQMGHVINHIIHVYTETKEDDIIFLAKEDVKDGFWICVAEEGQE